MRYFTRGWAEGELSDEDSERARSEYARRLDEIEPSLSPAMRTLARQVHLHDAIIDEVAWNPGAKELRLTLVTDALQGYEAVTLTYVGAMLGYRRVETLRAVARDREIAILYDEVDVDLEDGETTLIHRLIFWPEYELTIDFRELRLERSPRDDRRVELSGTFQIVEDDDDAE
jgi:hypothetical protein